LQTGQHGTATASSYFNLESLSRPLEAEIRAQLIGVFGQLMSSGDFTQVEDACHGRRNKATPRITSTSEDKAPFTGII
jgi:hypothetical protein